MRCLVIGSGQHATQEVLQAGTGFDRIIATNCAAERHTADIQISLHPNKYAQRKAAPHFVSFVQIPGVDEVFGWKWGNIPRSGSSGLYAVKYALERLHADEVVLAGVGMNPEPHEYGGANWDKAGEFRQVWLAVQDRLRGRVFSLGGWTQELLGPPKGGFFMAGDCHAVY